MCVRASHRRVTRTYDRSMHVLEPDAQRHNLGARRTQRVLARECTVRSHHNIASILTTFEFYAVAV